jgi:hypothetical protein
VEFVEDEQETIAGTLLKNKEYCEEGWLTGSCDGSCSGEVDEKGEPIYEIEECNPGPPGEYVNSCSGYTLKCNISTLIPDPEEPIDIDYDIYYYGAFFEGKKCEDLKGRF